MAASNVLGHHRTPRKNMYIRDALLAQRVSKSWQATTIVRSINLQRALFLKPSKADCVQQDQQKERTIRFMHLDTLCQQVLDARQKTSLLTTVLPIRSATRAILELKTTLPDPYINEHASWRRMLLTQPPRQEEPFFLSYSVKANQDDRSYIFQHRASTLMDSNGTNIERGMVHGIRAFKISSEAGLFLLDLLEAIKLEKNHLASARPPGTHVAFGWEGLGRVLRWLWLWSYNMRFELESGRWPRNSV